MEKARYLVALSCAFVSAACGTDVARAVHTRTLDAGPAPIPEKPPVCTSTKLADRLTEGSVSLSDSVRYRRTGYFYGFPQDDRIALSTATNNFTVVAWVNSAGTMVHVTPLQLSPLAMGSDKSRYGPDYEVEGSEVSGLVALADGFALLTRRRDPGEPLGEAMTAMQATYFVRWQNGVEVFAVPLTGTRSITEPADLSEKRDFPNGLSGRLAFNGSSFGAYFSVRGFDPPQGGPPRDKYPGHNGDKFVQIDENRQLVTAWRMGCRQHLGGRLVVDGMRFVTFCMSDGTLGDPGLKLVEGTLSARRLAPEAAPEFGYVGGNFGSVVKIPSGFLVAWASRGVTSSGVAAFESHEPAVALVGTNLQPGPRPAWPFLASNAIPEKDAVNVHAAPYGDDKVLLVWETIDQPQFRPNDGYGYSTGAYGGTHFQLIDHAGKPASEEEIVPRSIAPNGADDIVQFPNGDLAWAYVPEERNFQSTVQSNLPNISEIHFQRLTYCVPP